MAAHTPVEFTTFLSQLKETNQALDFFCDFDKIQSNVDDIRLSLCMLNSLIGATDMRSAVETIWRRDRSAFNVMDILIAVRSEGKKKVFRMKTEEELKNMLDLPVLGIVPSVDSCRKGMAKPKKVRGMQE